MDFQQSKTYLNLQKALEDELITCSKYQIYSIKAIQDGYIQVGIIFDTFSKFEREHAITWLKLLNNGSIPDTLQNLIESSENELYEADKVYKEFANTAREEGYNDIASLFDGIANIEMNHDTVFQTLADNIQTNTMFCKNEIKLWICTVCGNIIGGTCAPEICPICGFPQNYYQIYNLEL